MQNKVLELLRKYTRHEHIKITNRGNSAIFAALYIAKKVNSKPFILIPDQGGWDTYRIYPKMLNFEIKEVKTDNGLIDLQDLEEKAKSGAAFIFTSFAGYFAEQYLPQISDICRKNECLVIEDASGAISDEKLCNGEYSDMIVGSFGRWKPVNLGNGGFISAKEKDFFEKAKDVFTLTTFDPDYKKLYERLNKVKERMDLFFKTSEKIKDDLKDFEIIHKEKRGLNVVVRFKNKDEKLQIIDYCSKNNYEFVECPRYNRVNEDAISIEVKRLEIE